MCLRSLYTQAHRVILWADQISDIYAAQLKLIQNSYRNMYSRRLGYNIKYYTTHRYLYDTVYWLKQVSIRTKANIG